MTIKEIQKVLSSATTMKVMAAETKKDANNEVAKATFYVHYDSDITGLEDWEIDCVYPREKDVLEAWVIVAMEWIDRTKIETKYIEYR